VKVLFAASPLLLSHLAFVVLLIHPLLWPKTKSPLTSGEWGSRETSKLLLPLNHPPDVPNKKIEQHALFEHIIGSWRSAIIGKSILTSRLDVCQAEWILIILSRDIGIPIWNDYLPRPIMHLIPQPRQVRTRL
jgi:hypothetical protein